jgi:hypothetical protein
MFIHHVQRVKIMISIVQHLFNHPAPHGKTEESRSLMTSLTTIVLPWFSLVRSFSSFLHLGLTHRLLRAGFDKVLFDPVVVFPRPEAGVAPKDIPKL